MKDRERRAPFTGGRHLVGAGIALAFLGVAACHPFDSPQQSSAPTNNYTIIQPPAPDNSGLYVLLTVLICVVIALGFYLLRKERQRGDAAIQVLRSIPRETLSQSVPMLNGEPIYSYEQPLPSSSQLPQTTHRALEGR